MTTVPRRARRTPAPSVPLAEVRTLLQAVEDVLDLPKHGAPDPVRQRLAHMSGVLSAAEDAGGIRAATIVLRRVVDGAKDGAQ